MYDDDGNHDDEEGTKRTTVVTDSERCLRLVKEHNPSKEGEVRAMLEKFPGRERDVLKKLKMRYLGNEQRYG